MMNVYIIIKKTILQDWNKLYTKYLSRQCSEEEIRQLLEHFGMEGNESVLLPRIEAELARTDIPMPEDPEARAALERILLGLRKSIAGDKSGHRTIIIRRIKRWSSVAAILLIGSAIFYYTNTRNNNNKEKTGSRDTVQQDVLPGGNRAVLTLAEGRRIELSSRQKGIVVGNDITYEDGTSVTGGDIEYKDSAIRYAVLTTPRAGQYNITLPDGSRVWLNAETTLKYPLKFSGDQRVVELEGEAYFEVQRSFTGKKNTTLPFLVKTGKQMVKVLGTHFNVSAYPSEAVATTLTEGSVQVLPDSPVQAGTPLLLRPGQQSIISDDKARVIPVDTTLYIAWKNGQFNFNETELNMVMNQLKRWYDLTIEYKGDIPPTYYYGSISRQKNLADVLTLLKESGLNFSIEKGATTRLIISF